MNFNVYDLNKIFYDHIRSLSSPEKYGFSCLGTWDGPKYNCFFNVFLNSVAVSWIHYPSPYIDHQMMMKNHPHFYQIDKNYFLHWSEGPNCCFSTYGIKKEISFRELVLFMIYMKYLSLSCV